MHAEIIPGEPLAEALNGAIKGKIAELGWASGDAEDSAMAEYFILMLANGKTESEIATEVAGELLGLGPEDQTAPAFAKWVFEQVNILGAQLGGPSASADQTNGANGPHDHGMGDRSVQSLDSEMEFSQDGPAELNVPTGPKAMRNGGALRGGREKRLMGQINRAMDRSTEHVLHRVRNQSGNERIGRAPPSGPRVTGRQPRLSNGRMASISHGMTQIPGISSGPGAINGFNGMNGMSSGMAPGMPGNMNGMMGGMNNFMMSDGHPNMLALLEEQNRMFQEMQQMLLQSRGGHSSSRGRGKPLSERTSRPFNNRGNFGNHNGVGLDSKTGVVHQYQNGHRNPQHNGAVGPQTAEQIKFEAAADRGDMADEEMAMGQNMTQEAPKPEETICRWNLRCTNKDCKYAHQSPAAPPGITIDVKDACGFGAACKNFKCVGRHPSPAIKTAHQSQQDCKFWPNCTNPHCTFRHGAPPCRNGGNCNVANCRFSHVKTPCKFHPCTNRFCPFVHEEGQRGTFQDKVWTADGSKAHISERKFVNEDAPEDLVLPDENPETDSGSLDVIV